MITDCGCKIFKILRARCLPIVALFAVMAILAPQAAVAQGGSCQASGSIPMFPDHNSCATGALPGDNVNIGVTITNTSSTNPGGVPVAAELTGTIVVTLPVGDAWVDGGTNGCVSHVAGVASCSSGGANLVNITLTAGGVPLAAGAALVPIATIRTVVGGPAAPGCEVRGVTAATGPTDLETNDAACEPQVDGGAQGSSNYRRVECVTADTCPGTEDVCGAPTCVENACGANFAPVTTECRASAGDCDVPESCTGDSFECPADGFAAMTTECRAASGVCDVAESCPGDSAVCPEDGFATATTECRAASGECDAAESCPGTGPDCPIDEFQPSTTICNPGNPDVCDPAESCPGDSAICPPDDPGVGCVEATCRTVGYWGTHAGTEKDGSVNITQLTIALGGGSLDVCGETLTNTDVENGSSALEGICDSGGGRTQLARQLIALSLNCINSEGPADCLGVTQFETVFTACNAECAADANQDAINTCVGMVDCLNNGGQISMGSGGEFLCQTGTCSDNGADCSSGNKSNCADPALATCVPFESTCHDNPLLFPDTPAGSAKACNAARKSDCDIFNASCDVP